MPDNSLQLAKAIHEFFAFFGINLTPAVAGFLGALISLKYLPTMTGWQAWTTLLIGAAAANYLSPENQVTLWLFTIRPQGISFFIGLIAMSAFGGMMHLLNDWRTDPSGFLRRWWPFVRKGGE